MHCFSLLHRTHGAYLLLLSHTHQFHDALTLPARDGVVHRCERSLVDLHILLSSGFNGLLYNMNSIVTHKKSTNVFKS